MAGKDKELSAFDLSFIAEELKELVDGKVDKIYQIDDKEFLFQIHVPGKGKKLLKIVLPRLIFFTQHKPETPERPPGFCAFLRKYLDNSRIRSVKQKSFERIIEIEFSTKDAKYIMIIELFAKGNIILCSEDSTIISPLETQHWAERDIKRGEKYKFPEQRKNPFNFDEEKITELLEKTDREDIVKFIAMELSFGGIFAEEICARAEIDKREKPKKAHAKKIVSALAELKKEKLSPQAVFKDGELFDITPIKLKFFSKYEAKEFRTFSDALDSQTIVVKKTQSEQLSKHDKEIKRVERMVAEQEKTIQKMQEKSDESQQKGEAIYENYQQIDSILKQINKAREKLSWKEIKEKLKGHSIVKEINEKDKTIVIDLGEN